ncbi:MAG: hypothetical protein CM1200mP36_08930 [Gammaproteobacteria bacterium]|nr:MAG: hypothetical protein CM1200mP36_08930 [Gammaproteobacteria bacterium]
MKIIFVGLWSEVGFPEFMRSPRLAPPEALFCGVLIENQASPSSGFAGENQGVPANLPYLEAHIT